MAQANVNIRMDEATKKAFDKFCNEIGLSVSSAFNIFAKTVIREQRIPFELSVNVPNKATREALIEAEYIAAHPNEFKSYKSVDEMFKDILGEDDTLA